MDDLFIYSEPEEEYIKHMQLVFEKFQEAGIKSKMYECKFFQSEIEYLGHLISWKWVSPMKQKVKAITKLAPATNITEDRYIIGLIDYYGKFFLIYRDVTQPLNELT